MRWRPYFMVGLCLALGACSVPNPKHASHEWRQVGVARVDITPDYPVRLAGYAARTNESQGVTQRIWAKALVIGSDQEKPAVLLTADICGVPGRLRDALAARLQKRGIEPSRLALCCTHTHSAPLVAGYLSNLFGAPLKPEEQAHVDRYTREFAEALEKAVVLALANRAPARLSWAQGSAQFAANRRNKGGPVDHDLPALFVTGKDGKLRAVLAGYACHCTTLTGESNQVCGDWAGYAQETLEAAFPGAVAMISIGCGGDANPSPRPGLDLARAHGREIATNVVALQQGPTRPILGALECRAQRVELPLDKLPSRAEWEEKAKLPAHAGYQARMNLARLDRGERLPDSLPYQIQAWSFDRDLTLVFLAGEVVVDYSTRLKHEMTGTPVWITAYANDVPCYIPSERVLREGGYEGGAAMVYYDLPARFAPGLENIIVNGVSSLLRELPAGKPSEALAHSR